MNLNKKTVLITGSSRGIGHAIALQMAREKAEVILHASQQSSKAKKSLSVVRKICDTAEIFYAKIENRKEVDKLFDKVKRRFKRIDVLVNNAGIIDDKTITKMSDDQWDRVINTNLTGTYNVIKRCIPLLNNNGRIINISSLVGLRGSYGQSNYAASKAGIIGFTKSLALEMANKKITVNAVCPGYTQTQMVKKIPEKVMEVITEQIPLKRLAQPEEIARLVCFLASDAAGYITGQAISINGGLL